MTTIRHIIITLFIALSAYTFLAGASCDNNDIGVKCDNVVCDTISTYFVKQICDDKTIEYNLTYADTIKLTRADGEITFEIHQCRHCEGSEYVDIISHDNKVISKVKVNYKGGGQSERISLRALSKYIPTAIKINWTDHGKVFYVTK